MPRSFLVKKTERRQCDVINRFRKYAEFYYDSVSVTPITGAHVTPQQPPQPHLAEIAPYSPISSSPLLLTSCNAYISDLDEQTSYFGHNRDTKIGDSDGDTDSMLSSPTSCSSPCDVTDQTSQTGSSSDEGISGSESSASASDCSAASGDIGDGRSKHRKSAQPKRSAANRYTCTECGKQYATSSNLSRHKQTHRSLDSQQAKKCPHCSKVYVSMPALSMHILTHDLRHHCTVCDKAFSRPWLLQGHMRSHTGEKPYGCAHCGKAFADRSNLRAHMQTHSSVKVYACPRCSKSFTLKSYLNKHVEASCLKSEGLLKDS